MPLNNVKLADGRFLFRCPLCGFEHPRDPVKEHELGPPPQHNCKASEEIRFKDPNFDK